MRASDVTTEAPETGNGEVVDGERPAASNGHAAKKRKREKALAAVAANGHVSKVAQRRSNGSNGAVVEDEPAAEPPVLDAPPDGAVVEDEPAAEPSVPGEPLDAPTVEAPAVEEVDGAELNGARVEDLDAVERNGARVERPGDAERNGARVEDLDDERAEAEPAADDEALDLPPADEGRKARRRAAKRAKAEAKEAAPRGRAAKRARPTREEAAPRGRAAKRAKGAGEDAALRGRAAKRARAAYLATPAARRAQLVATAAEISAAAAEAEARPEATGHKRAAKYARRLFALVAVAMIPASVYALVVTDGPSTSLSRADASYLSAQLMTADQRVRRQLVRLRPRATSAAVARTRDAQLTARSLALELSNAGGDDAKLLRRALKLEAAWLDAVGSVLSNPRSDLRDELVARDAGLRPALDALPVPEGRRRGGAQHLVRYAKSRAAAAGKRNS